MITDEVIAGIKSYLSANAGTDLGTASFYARDSGSDLSYPAVIVQDDGDPEEDDILRGVWEVGVEVSLKTRPEGDEASTTHRAINKELNCLLGNKDRVKAALSSRVTCWDAWGGVGPTEPEDGYRVTTFKLSLVVALPN